MTDERERRWIPWTREADEKAKYISTIAGLFLAIIGSSSGILRVDKFGYSDFLHEIKIERQVMAGKISVINQQLEKQLQTERLITEAQIAAAIRGREDRCAVTLKGIEDRFDTIMKLDESTIGGLIACRDNYTQLHHDIRELRKRINGIGR